MPHVDIIIEDLKEHPSCPHGPTILFSRLKDSVAQRFFACAAYRERRACSFFLLEEDRHRINEAKQFIWDERQRQLVGNLSCAKHLELYNKLHDSPINKMQYCSSCTSFVHDEDLGDHKEHILRRKCDDDFKLHPTANLAALNDSRREAQFFFSPSTIDAIMDIFEDLFVSDVLAIGAPTIHEHIQAAKQKRSFLLDIDKRWHHFSSPSTYAWYNLFNHHFFLPGAEQNFESFLKNNTGKKYAVIIDPPFGGRIELIAETFRKIEETYRNLNSANVEPLKIFLIYPYFNEPHILKYLPNFRMLDYKVNYSNHTLFNCDEMGRKEGSPVRIFTNVDVSLIRLPPAEGYRLCEICDKWVAQENKHCQKCNGCPSKNGKTYKHCDVCNKCVKPTWMHCEKCGKCALSNHVCDDDDELTMICFNCKEVGHKRKNCPTTSSVAKKQRRD